MPSATSTLTCLVCGAEFDPAANEACPACPLHGGCTLVCCPVCGVTTVDPSGSAIVGLAERTRALLLDRRRQRRAVPGGRTT